MKEVVKFYTELANYMDESGYIKEAEELTQTAIKTAQTKELNMNPALRSFEQLVQQDAKEAVDIIMKGMKGEITKEEAKQKLNGMIQKQQSYKINNNITADDESVLLNKILKKNMTVKKYQTPVFRSTQEAENFYNQQHNFNNPQDAQKFQADKIRFMKSIGK